MLVTEVARADWQVIVDDHNEQIGPQAAAQKGVFLEDGEKRAITLDRLGISCTVAPQRLSKMGAVVSESRTLTCFFGDKSASTIASCVIAPKELAHSDAAALSIDSKTQSVTITLGCGEGMKDLLERLKK